MSYLLTGIIAIMLTALALVAGVSVYDSSSVGSSATAKLIESKLSHGAEAVANFKAGSDVLPTPAGDGGPTNEFKAMGLPDLGGGTGQGIDGAQWVMSCVDSNDCQASGIRLCIDIPDTDQNRVAAQSAARKLGGYAAGACSSPNEPIGTRDVVGLVLK